MSLVQYKCKRCHIHVDSPLRQNVVSCPRCRGLMLRDWSSVQYITSPVAWRDENKMTFNEQDYDKIYEDNYRVSDEDELILPQGATYFDY